MATIDPRPGSSTAAEGAFASMMGYGAATRPFCLLTGFSVR